MPKRAFLMLMLALLALPLGVLAQEATEAPTAELAPEESAHFRVAHFSIDTPTIQILFDGEDSGLGELDYGEVSNWLAVPAGAHEISLATSGSAEPVVAPLSQEIAPQGWTTIALVGSSEAGTLELVQFPEVTDELLPGTSRVTYFNAIEGEGGIGFFRDNNLYTTLAYRESFPIEHDTQPYSYHISPSGDSPQQLAELADLSLREGYNYLIAATGTVSEPSITVVETNPVEYLIGQGEVQEPGTLVEVIQANNLVGELEQALQQAGLLETLSGEGPYTFFAPAELKLENLPDDDPEALRTFLEGHLVEGLYQSQDLANGAQLTALNGQTINATVQGNSIFVNGAQVLDVNLPARNGTMHLISEFVTQEQ